MSINKDIISDLSLEIATKVFLFLPPEDICRTSKVSKNWNTIANNEFIWTTFEREMGFKPSKKPNKSKTRVVEFLKNKKFSIKIKTKKELLKLCDDFFNKTKLPSTMLLTYRSNTNPNTHLYAVICLHEDFYILDSKGRYQPRPLHQLLSRADKLTVTGCDEADLQEQCSTDLDHHFTVQKCKNDNYIVHMLIKASSIQHQFVGKIKTYLRNAC